MRRVVLVEDDATLQNLLQTLLELEGFQVAVSPLSSEEDILAAIRTQTPDVVLLDVHLKNADGVSILRAIRSQDIYSNTRVIMTSGMDVSERCLNAGANAFLMKPFMPADLIALLRG